MSLRFKLKGKVEKGKIHWDEGFAYLFGLHLQRLEGREIELVIGPRTKENSRPQQRYYFAVVVKELAMHLGYSLKEMEEILDYKFFIESDDRGFTKVRSKKIGNWTTVEWEEKMTEIRMWAWNEFSLTIALPNEVEY